MTDNNDTPAWQKRGTNLFNKMRNAVVDTVADAAGVANVRDPSVKSLQNNSNTYPSEVECHMCLELGVFRRCCNAYYCHLCYYRSGHCPGCAKEVPLTGIAIDKFDPSKFAVGVTWALSVLLVVSAATSLALSYWNVATYPVTTWGHTCRGWFPSCDLVVCVDFDGGIGYGEGGMTEYIPSTQPYRVCDRSLTANQVVGSACVYDQELYVFSNHTLGYDTCISSPRDEATRTKIITAPHPLLLLSDNLAGVYVFDDDFELPPRLASAPWHEIVNGHYSDACGVNLKEPPERGNHAGYKAAKNENALVFTGVYKRQAATVGLNVEHGGRVEFHIKMGAITNDEFSTCKTAYGGDVTLEYSVSSGEWIVMATMEVWKYRGHIFQFISHDIPIGARSNSTSFRFRQESFNALRDHWAIDDVRIRANFKPQWQHSIDFAQRQTIQDEDVKRMQCCYNTDQCSVYDKVGTQFDDEECNKIPGFDRAKRRARLKASELYNLFCLFAFFAKAAYQRVIHRFVRIASLRQKELSMVESHRSGSTELFPRRSFYSVSHLSWQYAVASVLLASLAVVAYRLLEALKILRCFRQGCKIDVTFVLVSLIGLMFDTRAIKDLLTSVFVVEVPWKRKPVDITVDLNPDKRWIRVRGRTIPLTELSSIERQNSLYCWLLSFCHVLGGLPIALGSLTARSFALPDRVEMISTILGVLAVLREVFGVSFVAKFALSVKWILAIRQDDRDEFGRAVTRMGLLQQFTYGSTFTTVVVMSSVLARRVGDVSPGESFTLVVSCIVFGGLFASLIGIMHGLPVIPEAYLTGWPSPSYAVSYYDRALCPCLFSCTYCGEVHSRQVLLVVSVDDMFTFKGMLKGNVKSMQGTGG